ncbi:peptidyl-tRNA hydrolase, chloroplastic-like isoform X2 [Pyrus communis]|uniref:peptidyl-tRNA hydrolase, chloroplastic-like isoform X2 n=1 Tax=Pyrus communis TaxID=23211 RepID=UPI0035C136E3
MNVAASLSSIATVRFPNCHRCFRFSKPLLRSPSLQIMSQFSSSPSPSAASAAPVSSDTAPVETKKPPKQPWLIVGLGNPGKKYNSTRHNVGFEMVDAIAEAEGIPLSSVSFKALVGKGLIGDVPVIFAKPQTYMNKSGESIFDDLDLPFGKLRMLPKGGHGGHNGMRSIIDHFKGSRDFPRLRIGIGRPPGKMDPVNFVLRPFTKQEQHELNFTFQDGVEAVRILLLEGFNKSATFVNTAKPLEQCG